MTDVEPPDLTITKRLLDACKYQRFVCQLAGTGELAARQRESLSRLSCSVGEP